MKTEGANETDVREEVASPLLHALGYERGTANEILREITISYDKHFLGRKKSSDPPLRGRADYVLSVAGAGRWVLEVKAPSSDIAKDEIDQAISYARHPEVSGTYAAILNGKRFVVMHSTQRSSDTPILDLPVSSVDTLASAVRGLLSPAAIRRDCSPPIVDIQHVLADGFRSTAAILGGYIRYDDFVWACNIPLDSAQSANLDETCRKMTEIRVDITGGRVWRDESSRIKVKLVWTAPHDAILQFAQDKNLLNAEYVSLDKEISNDPLNPTVFDIVGNVQVSEGEPVFDLHRWQSVESGASVSMNYRGQAVGHLNENTFFGSLQAEYESVVPLPGFDLQINMYGVGTFKIIVDPR